MLKLPSLKILIDSFTKTLLRFPFAIAFSAMASIVACILVGSDYKERKTIEDLYLRIIMASSMGVFSSIALSLYNERLKKGTTGYIVTSVLKLAFPLVYFFLLPEELNIKTGVRFGMLMLAMHLLVSFAPFAKYGTINGFWQYNKTLFIHFLTSILYTSVLYLGIAASIGTTSLLFDINFDSVLYVRLWFLLIGLFNTSFFLSGVPEYYNELDNEVDYPQGLKIFTQFVLVPLVVLYLGILYAYEVKILFTMDLPKGIVAYLVIGYAIFGILALLLVYPIQHKTENTWIKWFSKWFYLALIPLIILLLWAIGVRVAEYGITENRYIILALTIWLSFITLYFIFNRHKNIKVIPVSLCIATLIAAYGPLSAFEVSKFSQRARLTKLLESNGLLNNGKIETATKKLEEKVYLEIESIVDYMVYRHGLGSLQKFSATNLDSLEKALDVSRWQLKDTAMAIIGIPKQFQNNSNQYQNYISYHIGDTTTLSIKGYETLLVVDSYNMDYTKNNKFKLNETNKTLVFKEGKEAITMELLPLLNKIKEDEAKLTKQNQGTVYAIETSNSEYNYKLIISRANFYQDNEGLSGINLAFYWLSSKKNGKK